MDRRGFGIGVIAAVAAAATPVQASPGRRRVSVIRGDSGYTPYCAGIRILLDGVEIRNCITADEARGEVFVHKNDSSGRIICRGDEIVVFRETGHVRIVDSRARRG